MDDKIRLGISTCLLGQPVRYDGGHKFDPFLVHTLGQYVTWVPVCPEVECGLPTPREAMRLVGEPAAPRLVTIKTRLDHTERMTRWAAERLRALEAEDLCGYVFKSKSPSSGMERVKVYDGNGVPKNVGVGVWAGAFMTHFPLLPVEEEGRLHDPRLRDNFVERIFALKRFRDDVAATPSVERLVAFHGTHKLLLLAHSPAHAAALGKLVAGAAARPLPAVLEAYRTGLLAGLRVKTTPAKHANVLTRMLGFFKRQLSADEKQELLETISLYRNEQVPLVVPLTLFKHYVRKYAEPYLGRQSYLNPHPIELQLRNHV